MQKTNWLILATKDRGIDYGVGTFIKQLSQGLVKKKSINVFILEIGCSNSKIFNIKRHEGITFFEIPSVERTDGIDSTKNQNKIAQCIARVVLQYIPEHIATIVHMNFIFQYFIALEFKKVLNCHVIFTQHVFLLEEKTTTKFFDTEFETYKMVDHIATVTRHGKDHLINKGVNENKIEVIYNGIDPRHFELKQYEYIKVKYGFFKNEKIIFYSGRIDPIKGLNYLSSAFILLLKKYPDCRLVIAGNGNFESLIKSTKYFSANISFLGFIPFEDVVALYKVSDIGVIPSLEEHCSYVALEMLHCGLPVVASKLGGLKEIFIHNKNALLVDTEPNQSNIYGISPLVDQLANKMYELLDDDKLRIKFSKNAIIRANKEFTLNRMIDNYITIITNFN
ncbi:MAG: glycosyltransferase [Bacteroidetes bacterium]|nr:glycosyltransferase [Bacteroidota bacterium]